MTPFDVVIIGGGPAGASAAIGLADGGVKVAVIEKKAFPREVLCGEFLSHEVISALGRFGLTDEFRALGPQRITTVRFTPENDVHTVRPLGFEAWALKRSLLDDLLLRRARIGGATVVQPVEVVAVHRDRDRYVLHCRSAAGLSSLSAQYVIAAHGKYSALDRFLQRDFLSRRSGLIGLKYHLPESMFTEALDGDIRLFTAHGIYCGLNRVNDRETTLCFLAQAGAQGGHPRDALAQLLQRNRAFRSLVQSGIQPELYRRPPYGAGNIFIGEKDTVTNGIFHIGDAAAVIAPLAGDGIGMAIESGQLLARVLLHAGRSCLDRRQTEMLYTGKWRRLFSRRLAVASWLQKIVMTSTGGNAGAHILKRLPRLTDGVIQWTRSGRHTPADVLDEG